MNPMWDLRARREVDRRLQRRDHPRRADGLADHERPGAGVIADAHVHFWDPGRLHYDWLPDELRRPFLPGDYDGGADALVFVQADCRADEGLAEVEWVSSLGAVAAIVAFAPLEEDPQLEFPPIVRGVRRLLQGQPDALFDAVVPGVRRCAVFDACVTQDQLPRLTTLAARCPETTIVLDHLGKPRALDPWRDDLARLAELPNVRCKLSGLEAELGPRWTLEQVRPFLERALDVFGPERCLYGSDWPLTRDPARWLAAVTALAPASVLANATTVYNLNASEVFM
jgi:L-fuconolactonase